MKLPTPQELGLPEKFARWRPVQEEALAFLLTSQKRTKALCMPTGSGKSAVYIAYALMTKRPTAFVTDSRALQDQLLVDFHSVGLVDLRGRRNYTCDFKDDYTCEDGYQAQCPYKGSVGCPSSRAEMQAATSPLVVTNYDKWTSAKKFGMGMSHFQQVIFDEGHEAPNALARAMQVTLGHREREKDILMDPPADTSSLDSWKVWASDAREIVEVDYKKAMDALKTASDPRPSLVRQVTHLRNLYRRLGILAVARPQDWVLEEVEKGFQFDPVRPGRYAEGALMLRVPSVVVISATLRPKTLYLMGQGTDTFDFKEFDSDFDPKRCPIYWVPTMRVDSKAPSLSPVWNRLDQIMARRKDRKGIVHTVSYGRRDVIITASRFADHMLINERGEAATEIIELFRNAGPGTTLVSPSVGQGYDFPYADCEWQFMCKIPFPPPSQILKARTADDSEYPYYLAIQKMVQVFGRGMRAHDDRCENFIPDDHVEWFIPRYGHLAPKSFKQFYQRADVLPQPPAKLTK